MNKEIEPVQKFGGAWTALKIDILRKYLDAYTIALQKQPYNLIYIDAFAGCGEYRIKSTNTADRLFKMDRSPDIALREGSARAALNIKMPFHEYHFIDLSPKNIKRLEELKTEYQHLPSSIHIYKDDANNAVREICNNRNWYSNKAVLFLDPFNLEVDWDTIKAIGGTGSIDMWFLFPISAVNRMLTKKTLPPEGWQNKLDEVFGAPDWRTELYSTPAQQQMSLLSLLPEEKTVKDTDFSGIKEYTENRLKTVFSRVSPNSCVLKNKTNSPLFVLFFAVSTSNQNGQKLALRMANHILKNTE